MNRPRPEPVQVVKQRRDTALAALVGAIPYAKFLGVHFDRRGDELTATLPFDEKLIGNPFLPALHGGATSAFLEITALIELSWSMLWEEMESGQIDPGRLGSDHLPRLPKTIDFTVDYLRSGRPVDTYGRAVITKQGRRVATVHAEAWQDDRLRPIAAAHGHFLLKPADEPAGS